MNTVMFIEARKLYLLEEVLKVTNEATLIELEEVLKKAKKKSSKEKKPSIYDFMGIVSKKEAAEMRKAIEETCEQIYPDDWK